MDDLPAIIHRLSVRAFNPEFAQADEQAKKAQEDSQPPIDPLASPPQDAVDDGSFDDREASLFSLDNPTEMHASFSQKNMLRLAALTESQRTLSLFTPSMRDTVFRAWAGATERTDSPGTNTPLGRPQVLARLPSSLTTSSAWSASASETSETPSLSSRPSLKSYSSAATSYTMGTNKSKAHAARKRKHRTVDLRKNKDSEQDFSDSASVGTNYSNHASASASAPSITVSEAPATPIKEQPEFRLQSPPKSGGSAKVHFQREDRTPTAPIQYPDPDTTPRPLRHDEKRRLSRQHTQPQLVPAPAYTEKRPSLHRSLSTTYLDGSNESFTGGVLERAWVAKIQAENKRRVQWEKARRASVQSWDKVDMEESPPPAYVM